MSISKIDSDLCTGCGTCVDTCSMDAIRLNTLPGEGSEHPPCRLACPAGVDMRTYIYLLRNGMYEHAARSLREQNPFPAITGRVCPHPCEADCARGKVDEAVNVGALERFVGDRSLGEKPAAVPPIYLAKVAVVGSGPAGLSCAWFLARRGYAVTVFEAAERPGGMLRQAIPEYRLPAAVLDAETGALESLGVEIRTGVTVGKDLAFAALRETYGAVFWASGNQLAARLELPGAELDGVLWGLDFLRAVRRGEVERLAGSVVVIGGGSVAVDAALTALRLGASTVRLVCLEDDAQMPAYPDELRQAREEGVLVTTCRGPAALTGEGGRVQGVELVECTSVYDVHGAFNPTYGAACEEALAAGTVIFAVGQAPDVSLLPEGLALAGGRVRADPVTMATSLPGVFAGGDIAGGAATVVSAIAAGRRAAESIDRYLKGEDLLAGRTTSPPMVKKTPCEGIRQMPRQEAAWVQAAERTDGFREVKLGLDEDAARLESQRCLTCGARAEIWYPDDCMMCTLCETDCPEKALYVSPEKLVLPLLPWG